MVMMINDLGATSDSASSGIDLRIPRLIAASFGGYVTIIVTPQPLVSCPAHLRCSTY
jgi:hypothetical protein